MNRLRAMSKVEIRLPIHLQSSTTAMYQPYRGPEVP